MILSRHADPSQSRKAKPISISYVAAGHHMIYGKRRRVENRFLRFNSLHLRQIGLQRFTKRQKDRNDRILFYLASFYRHQCHQITKLTVYVHRRRAGVPAVTFLHPHFRAEQPKRRLMFPGNTDT